MTDNKLVKTYKPFNSLYVNLSLAIFLWLVAFFPGISTAFSVWRASEIYNHCFFVLPCVAYFSYVKRQAIYTAYVGPSWLLLSLVVPLLFIQVFAQAGDIKVLMHIATFSALPILIAGTLGVNACKQVIYPLFILIFAIPIGDQLVPLLQELTADLAVPLLELTNVPVYRNGLYLEIPEGRFLVAEACSGISFLITSIFFGFVYSYVSYKSLRKRTVFILLSFLVPIAANALRVYGIILTGHLTDMEHAVGADHLIYGGIFFGIVLFILICIGELIRDKNYKFNSENKYKSEIKLPDTNFGSISPLIGLSLLIAVQQVWLTKITTPIESPYNYSLQFPTLISMTVTKNNWEPNLDTPSKLVKGEFHLEQINAITYIAYFDELNSEMISTKHRFYRDDRWSLEKSSTISSPINLKHLTLISQSGQRKYVYYGYFISKKLFASAAKAKLYQSFLRLKGEDYRGVVFIMASDVSLSKNALDNLNELMFQ